MSSLQVDLHTHTVASDGTNAPEVNVQLAKSAGLGAVAITDHDTVAGIEEALEEGARIGLTVVPGVEISTVAGGVDIHVLGYFADYRNELFLQRLASLRDTRDKRNEMILGRLRELGLAVTMEEVIHNLPRPLREGETIGRPHIADLLMKKGYVATLQEAFDNYLATGSAAYVNPPRIHPAEAVAWIHEAGGAAVLAHPGIYGRDDIVQSLVEGAQLDGIEVYHSDHTEEDAARYLEMAKRHQLLVTAGSDYHGERAGIVFHAPIGTCSVPMDILPALEQRAKQWRGGAKHADS
ncbi:PHP domain-containing protein [Paenibacillus sp. y28]|uniref:PHP domain-containing protein n=1 Tax=Paenibacillus sp. y28 TaxID=3129110 RepID=UPI003017B2AD